MKIRTLESIIAYWNSRIDGTGFFNLDHYLKVLQAKNNIN